MQIAGIVRDNPERVAADMEKSPQHRTEHDPERAHLIALTIGGNMTRLAADHRRTAAGKRLWRKATHQKALLGSKMGEDLATEIYDHNPLQAVTGSYSWLTGLNSGVCCEYD